VDLPAYAIVSAIGDEVTPALKNRGVRFWSTVEVHSERWFQVETCTEYEGCRTLKSAFASNFSTVKKLIRRFSGNRWTAVRLYTRLPLHAADGYVFETITRVFELQGSYYYLLSSGLMLRDDCNEGNRTGLRLLSDAKTVYTVENTLGAAAR
jgi:hypothetical protein